MTIKIEIYEILKNRIPLVRDNDVSFEDFIKNQFNEYFKLVNIFFKYSCEYKAVQEFAMSVDKIFKFYESNLFYKSFEVFKNMFLNFVEFDKNGYIGILPIININYNELNLLNSDTLNYYFRISNYCTSLLHIPFEHRGHIESNRFTDKGIPCFYGGSSILTCIGELKGIITEEAYISCFEYDYGRFPILDLTMPALNVKEIEERFLDRYILSWPIIALCMMRKNPLDNETVRPKEYVIPQYILKLLASKQLGQIRAVRYFSSKSTPGKSLINIAIPTTTEKDRGYCHELRSVFMDNDRDPCSPNFLRWSKPKKLKDLGVDLYGSEFSSIENMLKNEIIYKS
jgi:hypothetical protein